MTEAMFAGLCCQAALSPPFASVRWDRLPFVHGEIMNKDKLPPCKKITTHVE